MFFFFSLKSLEFFLKILNLAQGRKARQGMNFWCREACIQTHPSHRRMRQWDPAFLTALIGGNISTHMSLLTSTLSSSTAYFPHLISSQNKRQSRSDLLSEIIPVFIPFTEEHELNLLFEVLSPPSFECSLTTLIYATFIYWNLKLTLMGLKDWAFES